MFDIYRQILTVNTIAKIVGSESVMLILRAYGTLINQEFTYDSRLRIQIAT